jgi:hypothetical protein
MIILIKNNPTIIGNLEANNNKVKPISPKSLKFLNPNKYIHPIQDTNSI